jgi:Ca2+-binding EF-hand superfamily protein
MLGHFQRQKAHHYFDLIDQDADGYIDGDDFELQASRLADRRDLSNEAREALMERMMAWWEQLCATADANQDDRVSREEWAHFWKAVNASVEEGTEEERDQMLASLEQAGTATFQTIDTTGSGEITKDEFENWLAAWGAEGSGEAFDRLDRSGNGHLTREDLVEATKEFYLSDDPDAPGTVLYGMLQ